MGGFELPESARPVRTTPRFDAETLPAGLLSAHRLASGVWGELRVWSGEVVLAFEDAGEKVVVAAGQTVVIPPERPHHLVVDGPVELDLVLHREAGRDRR